MEPIKPTATLTSKIGDQHEPADGDAANGTIGGLPFHLTERILRLISPLESAPLAAVCKSWAATISERLATPTPHLFALEVFDEGEYLLDLLFLPDLERCRGAVFSVPVDDEVSPAPVIPARLPAVLSHAEDDKIRLSGALPCGGLSFAEGNRVVLVNPVTGAFESIEMYPPRNRVLIPPTVRAAAGADAFFVSLHFERTVSLRWREEDEWTERKLLLPEECGGAINLVAYSGGIFYAMEFFGFTNTVDTRSPPPWRLMRLRAPSILRQYSPIGRYRYLQNCHLLQSEGEIMFVGPVLAPDELRCPNTIGGFEVYKLDLGGPRWVKVERLADDRALFVSEQSSFAVRASETPRCRANCIYFVSELDEHSYSHNTWGVYSMEEQKVLFQRPIGGSQGKYKAARWFIPVVSASPACSVNCANSGKKRKIQML
uniref:KIB1-4 beta-propeller domain-containing protein n=1 Tax=Hordeum vulgare subsp. vulgare TaxID=112509 RepID=A0A8I6Z1I1_HORVV